MSKKQLVFLFILIVSIVCRQVGARNPIFVITIPKSGTTLLTKLIQYITNRYSQNLDQIGYVASIEGIDVYNENIFFHRHLLYTEESEKILNNKGCKLVFLYRDPRDQVVSWVKYINSVPLDRHPDINMYFFYQKIGFDDALLNRINGIAGYYGGFLGWIGRPSVYSTKFEDLVGPLGGGSEERQVIEIMNIARHIGYPVTLDRAKIIANSLFGGTGTFMRGQIGTWKKTFNAIHKQLFKERGDGLLVKLGYEKDFSW